MAKTKHNEPLVFELTVQEMKREAVAQASVHLVGKDTHHFVPGTYVKMELRMPPHKARKMGFATKWKMTLEPVADD